MLSGLKLTQFAMTKIKIITIIGARPQFIKAAALSREMCKFKDINEVIIHTGQHYDNNMSDIFFQEMSIPKPKYNLGIGGTTHGKMTGRQLEKIEEILITEKPNFVLVYGDTNSTLAGALAAAKLHIPVAHIESGLRSFNKKMPEEINRILTDHISDILFVPTKDAISNLINEGIDISKIINVGDVMYDAALFYKDKAIKPIWFDKLNLHNFILCTIHRAENTDSKFSLSRIFEGLCNSRKKILLPLHPRTLEKIKIFEINISDNIIIVPPTGYLEMVWLEMNCEMIVTDSGGVQKEAFFHNKFCVTLREQTEWNELVDSGWNELVGNNVEQLEKIITNFKIPSEKFDFYGNGDACHKILKYLNERK